MTYTEQINSIRQKYNCAGDLIFNTALQTLLEVGQCKVLDPVWCSGVMDGIDLRHDAAEKENKILFMTRDFEKAILECSKELAGIKPIDLIMYIQRETWLGNDGISYKRAIELLKDTLAYCARDTYESEYALEMAKNIGFTDDEIVELGHEWMFDSEEEEE